MDEEVGPSVREEVLARSVPEPRKSLGEALPRKGADVRQGRARVVARRVEVTEQEAVGKVP